VVLEDGGMRGAGFFFPREASMLTVKRSRLQRAFFGDFVASLLASCGGQLDLIGFCSHASPLPDVLL
jgi:hypothetical protein